MLRPHSSATLGITERRKVKFGFPVPVDPLTDSDDAMRRFSQGLLENGDPFGLLEDDEDSLPCVERDWSLPNLEDENVLDVCATAWLRVAEVLREVYDYIGIDTGAPGLECRHESDRIRFRVYEREDLRNGIIKGYAF